MRVNAELSITEDIMNRISCCVKRQTSEMKIIQYNASTSAKFFICSGSGISNTLLIPLIGIVSRIAASCSLFTPYNRLIHRLSGKLPYLSSAARGNPDCAA
jgi:hypothetical protein